MTSTMFLEQLRSALGNDLNGALVQENVNYYKQYIIEEMNQGRTESEVLQMLGDPWIIARTIIDAQNGTDQTVADEARRAGHGFAGRNVTKDASNAETQRNTLWWKKVMLIAIVVLCIVVIFTIITGVIRLLAPILIPLILILIFMRMFGKKK